MMTKGSKNLIRLPASIRKMKSLVSSNHRIWATKVKTLKVRKIMMIIIMEEMIIVMTTRSKDRAILRMIVMSPPE
jgi:hypothetical protein